VNFLTEKTDKIHGHGHGHVLSLVFLALLPW
jgi:hypothetical protein